MADKKRIMLTIAYDGTNYVGWQIQKNGTAVEAVVNEALCRLLNEAVYVIGASRTDSGVHAGGNVAVFDTETKIAPEKISFALNKLLPKDIKIVRSCEVSPDFHPRHADCVKSYRYSILNARFPHPLYRLYADYVYYPIDVDLMRRGAAFLIGEHDFTAFSTAGGQQHSPVRTIYSIDIDTASIALPAENIDINNAAALLAENIDINNAAALPAENIDINNAAALPAENIDINNAAALPAENMCGNQNPAADKNEEDPKDFTPQMIYITVRGNGFLYNMVRIIAGTLEKVGMGVFPPEHVREILESLDRSKSSPKAAARGLELVEIRYNLDYFTVTRSEE